MFLSISAPNTQGQPNDGQQQQGNAGFGQDGNRQTNTQTFRFNGQPGVPTNGDPRMGQQPFIPVSGMNAGFPQAPAAGFPAGPMGPTGTLCNTIICNQFLFTALT